MASPKIVLVTGATGQQGGSVVNELLIRDHEVRGVTRNPDSPSARQLAAKGVTVVRGDFADPASLRAAMEGVDAVFAMGTPYETGPDAETRQGIAVADAARAVGVGHLVYTSVAGANRGTGIPHFESKLRVEEHLAGLGIPWTVIAPVAFMEGVLYPQTLSALKSGQYPSALPGDRVLQQVAVADIGGFAAHVIGRPEEYAGQRIELASDAVSPNQVAATLTELLGRPIVAVQTPIAQIRAFSEDLALMYEWFVAEGYDVDIAALKVSAPEIGWHTFRTWASENLPGALAD